MNQKSFSTNQENSMFHQSHSVALRIWHWVTFLVITGSIITVIFNSTLLSPRDNVKMVQEQLTRSGLTVTDQQAFAVSHEYEDKMWNVHKYLGYGLAFLLLARIVIEFTQPKEEKLKNRMRKAMSVMKEKNDQSADSKHFIRVRQLYMLFFLMLFALVVTGLGMVFGREIGLSREFNHTIKEVHGFIQYLMYAFILVHLAGVILAENGKLRGVVSGMIHGNL